MTPEQARRAIADLQIDAYKDDINGFLVCRTGSTHYMVLRDNLVKHIGWGNYSVGYAIALTVEAVTGIRQPRPCAKCGKPKPIASRPRCPECQSAASSASQRRRRERERLARLADE